MQAETLSPLSPAPNKRRFEFIDGLRGIAALLVVFFHFNNLLKDVYHLSLPSVFNSLFSQGHCGVEIFFVLSGFVISYSIRNYSVTLPFACQFFIKRSIRLDPPYWITMALLVVLSLCANCFKSTPAALPSSSEIFANLFYLAGFLHMPWILPVAWTLALEIQFYLFLILLIKVIQPLNRQSTSRKFSSSALAIISGLIFFSLVQNTSYAWLPSLSGLFIYEWYSFSVGCLACWAMLGFISSRFFWIHLGLISGYAIFYDPDAIVTCLTALLIFYTAYQGRMHERLASPLFQYLGRISYSLYLTHWAFGLKILDLTIRYFGTDLDHFIKILFLMIFALGCTLLGAEIFYRLVEEPSIKLSQRLKFNPRSEQRPLVSANP